MTRPDPALVAEVMAENRPRLLDTLAQVQRAIAATTPQGKSDKPTTPPTRKAA